MSMKLHDLPNTSLQKCFLENFTSTSEALKNCNKHINLTDAEQEIPITPWKLGYLYAAFTKQHDTGAP